MNVPNLQKGVKNQSCWSGEKSEDEHDKTKPPLFASQLKNL